MTAAAAPSLSQPMPWPRMAQVAVLATLAVAISAEPFLRLVEMRESNVYAHVDFARKIAETHVLYPGHFLYHLLTVAMHAILPVSWLQASVLVLLGARVSLAIVLWHLVRRSLRAGASANDALVAIVVPLALMFASAISFPTWSGGHYYLGYIVPNIAVSQTMVVLQPLALLTFVMVVRVLGTLSDGVVSVRDLAVVGLLALVSTLAKPSYAMVLLPAVGILLLAMVSTSKWRGDRVRAIATAAALGTPVMVAMGWIYVSTYLKLQGHPGGTGIAIAPLRVMDYLQQAVGGGAHVRAWLLAKFLLSALFPIVVAVTWFPRIRHDLRFRLAWLQFAIGLIFTYFFAERPTFTAGNFTWSAQTALFILFVVSALLLIEQTMTGTGSRLRRLSAWPALVCYGVLLLHVVAGYGLFLHPAVN